MRKTTLTIAAIAAAVVVGGGGAAYALTAATTATTVTTSTTAATSAPTDTDTASSSPTATATSTSSPSPTATLTTGPTAKGEVCDPHNLNDVICAAFYPDQAVLNMTAAGRAGEPLASLSNTARVSLAHKACDQLAAGATLKSVNVIGTDSNKLGVNNNFSLGSAASLAYCNNFIDNAKTRWALDEYRKMGEAAAKASFATGHVIQP